MNTISLDTVSLIQSFGFDVYMRSPLDSWCYFTDGVQIGYLEYNEFRGFNLSTVHAPNQMTGTGFSVGRGVATLNKGALEGAFISSPGWASEDELKTVRKYQSVAEFLNASAFHREYMLCAKAEAAPEAKRV
jgi:hypothetical protein